MLISVNMVFLIRRNKCVPALIPYREKRGMGRKLCRAGYLHTMENMAVKEKLYA